MLMFTLYYFSQSRYNSQDLTNDIFTYQVVNKYPDLADLGIELDDLSFVSSMTAAATWSTSDALRPKATFGTAVLACEDISPMPAGSCGTVRSMAGTWRVVNQPTLGLAPQVGPTAVWRPMAIPRWRPIQQ